METRTKKTLWLLPLILILAISLLAVGCGNDKKAGDGKKEKIVLAGGTWDSILVNTEIVSYILENGFGYETDTIMAASMIEITELAKGSIDIRMENWKKTYGNEYYDPVASGDIIEINNILKENGQGLYVPRYMLEGDAARGIAPMTPDLKKLQDLPEYKNIFKDPEDATKGRIYGAPNDWSTNTILQPMLKNLGVDTHYNLFMPGSNTALDSAIASAYERGMPVVAYYWEPTWLLGLYDMVKLELPPFDQAKWDAKSYDCAFPPDDVIVAVNKNLPNTAPEVVDMLKKFTMTSGEMNAILAFMQKNNVGAPAAALEYLKTSQDTWSKWMPQEIADKVAVSLK